MNGDVQKMTRKSQEAMQAAAKLAESLKNSVVEPEHLLTELVEQEGGLVPRLLEESNVKPKDVAAVIAKALAKLPKVVSGSTAQVFASNRLQRIFQEAEQEARKSADEFISTEHFFLAMLKSADSELKTIFKETRIQAGPVT